jgi:hypothetical protein
VKNTPWERASVINSVRDEVWRYITQAAQQEREAVLEAAALLQMHPHEVRTLAQIHFIASDAVGHLLDQMPLLIRRLRTTTVSEQEISAERVRGSIQWAATFGARAATGLPHVYVATPARRAFETPENQVLVFALDAIRSVGRKTGWHRSAAADLGMLVRDRVTASERWLRTRMLAELRRTPPSPQLLARVRSSRVAKRYQAALDVVALHTRYVRRVDRRALRAAIQDHALVTSRDEVLLELMCGFALERALENLGWKIARPGLVGSGLFLRAKRASSKLDLYYQHPPPALAAGSLYRAIQKAHPFQRAGPLVPDFVLRLSSPDSARWLLIEVKGLERSVSDSARAALHDLLAYRRAFDPVLSMSAAPYGLGIAWGESLPPSGTAEIALCTPDTVQAALTQLLPAAAAAGCLHQPADRQDRAQ